MAKYISVLGEQPELGTGKHIFTQECCRGLGLGGLHFRRVALSYAQPGLLLTATWGALAASQTQLNLSLIKSDVPE